MSYDLMRLLEALERSGLIRVIQLEPELRFEFHHALVRDAAYLSLLKADRRLIHLKVAETLEHSLSEAPDQLAQEIAHHFAEAGEWSRAFTYFRHAGGAAASRFANIEAEGNFNNAIHALKLLPPGPDTDHKELDTLVALGPILRAVKGYSAVEIGETYSRAVDLCLKLGDSPAMFPVTMGLWSFAHNRGPHSIARRLAEQALNLAQGEGQPSLLMSAFRILGTTQLWSGQLGDARQSFQQALTLHQEYPDHADDYGYGNDPITSSLIHLAHTNMAMGYLDSAVRNIDDALIRSRLLGQPYTEVFAMAHAAYHFALARRDMGRMRELAEAVVRLASERKLAFWPTLGNFVLGIFMAQSGSPDDGLAQMVKNYEHIAQSGLNASRTGFLVALAHICLTVDRIDECERWVEEAMALAETSGEYVFRAEILRLRGEMLIGKQGAEAAEGFESLQRAFELAHDQDARLWELRAATSMARLGSTYTDPHDAQVRLAATLSWFTEGFDLPDLRDARALLGQ